MDLRHFSEHDFVAFTRHTGPAYFDQSIHLCRQAGFSPRIRYEASTLHGVLDLVGAGLGVALVPASACLLGNKALRVWPLRRRDQAEVLALLRRKSDANPLLSALEQSVSEIFHALASRLERML
jgi:DNA-binding transcriptional LysR family regulator